MFSLHRTLTLESVRATSPAPDPIERTAILDARMRIATWNVNGIRARRRRSANGSRASDPDVVCLQEIKATPSIRCPRRLLELGDYWCYWHGEKGYSGVALHVSKALSRPTGRQFSHPAFDYENRIVAVADGRLDRRVDLRAQRRQGLPRQDALPRGDGRVRGRAAGALTASLVLCGDLNVARTDIDVHPKERKPRAIGQLPEERALLERIIARGLVDVGRALDPTTTSSSPGGRRGGTCASATSAGGSTTFSPARRSAGAPRRAPCSPTVGTSDHAPVIVDLDLTGIDLGSVAPA